MEWEERNILEEENPELAEQVRKTKNVLPHFLSLCVLSWSGERKALWDVPLLLPRISSPKATTSCPPCPWIWSAITVSSWWARTRKGGALFLPLVLAFL